MPRVATKLAPSANGGFIARKVVRARNFAGLPDQTAEIVKSWATNGAFIITCINTVLHLYSAPTAGPMAK